MSGTLLFGGSKLATVFSNANHGHDSLAARSRRSLRSFKHILNFYALAVHHAYSSAPVRTNFQIFLHVILEPK
jgi:hypothetical protein